MLINIRTSELQSNTGNSIYLAIFIGIALNYPIFQILPFSIAMVNNYFNLSSILYFFSLNRESMKNVYSSFGDMPRVAGNGWENYVVENSHMTSIGNIMYTNNNPWLFLVSLILLLEMVGAIIIIIKPNHIDEVKNYKPVGKPLQAKILP